MRRCSDENVVSKPSSPAANSDGCHCGSELLLTLRMVGALLGVETCESVGLVLHLATDARRHGREELETDRAAVPAPGARNRSVDEHGGYRLGVLHREHGR